MTPVVLAFAEARDGELRKVSHEAVTAARSIADQLEAEVHAVVFGTPGVGERAKVLGRYGADKVLAAESASFELYRAGDFAHLLVDLIQERGYGTVVFPASALGKDLAPRLAARLGVPCVTECTGLEVEGQAVVATRPVFAGKAFVRQELSSKPVVLSIRPNVFTPRESPRDAALETVEPAVGQDQGARVTEVRAASGEKLDVAEAPVVVSGGRGLQNPDNFKLLEELADALGNAAVGASRAVVDAGWRPHADQVGQTGKTVAPTLYFAVGISGAIQHLAGMRTAKIVVAINKDADAPIFKVADYGIVGDLFEIVPRLTEEVKKLS
ncbi:MAG: electron transfer flavoprotein subunit alpha/FixB family protein [Longimicrobiaceae bacterium]